MTQHSDYIYPRRLRQRQDLGYRSSFWYHYLPPAYSSLCYALPPFLKLTFSTATASLPSASLRN